MNKSNLLKTLEERPLRMAVQPELPRRQVVVLRTAYAPAKTPADNPVWALVILGLAFWLVYAFMQGVQA